LAIKGHSATGNGWGNLRGDKRGGLVKKKKKNLKKGGYLQQIKKSGGSFGGVARGRI